MKPTGYWLNRTDKAFTSHMNGMLAEFALTRTAWQVLNVVDDSAAVTAGDIHAGLAGNAEDQYRTAVFVLERMAGNVEAATDRHRATSG